MNRQGLLAAAIPFSCSELSFPQPAIPDSFGVDQPPKWNLANIRKTVQKNKRFFYATRFWAIRIMKMSSFLRSRAAAQALPPLCPCCLPPPPGQAVDKEMLVMASEQSHRRSLGPGPRHSRKNPEAEGSANFSSAPSSCGQVTKPVPSRSRGHHGSPPLRALGPASLSPHRGRPRARGDRWPVVLRCR